ncbi:MAG: formylglycine-generating enzyme family protein [Planctomycetaceae bacterium]|nr:MAG: formylglycine-generating enzyme family protein [Planctomycetaceae bacterium]
MRLRIQVSAVFAVLILTLADSGLAWDDAIPKETRELLKTFHEEFVAITPGQGMFPASFVMGTVGGPFTEQPAQAKTLPGPFSMAKYEVPQNLWQAVMGSNPSKWKGPRNSVEMFNWNEAQDFCTKVTALLRQAELIGEDEQIRIPTEVEWEYCCRAGTTTPYSFGESATKPGDIGNKASVLDEFGWHTGNAAGNDPPVGAKKPNAWGLFDMHGYLREFVSDEWRETYSAPAPGAEGQGRAVRRVVRSGSWKDRYECLRSAYREPIDAEARDDAVGLRCVLARTPGK